MSIKAKLGAALAIGVIGGAASAFLALLLLLFGVFLIVWDREPARTHETLERLPYGEHLVKALSRLDTILS